MDLIGGAILAAAVLNLFSGGIILFYGKKTTANKTFAGVILSVFFWAITILFMRMSSDESSLLLWAKLLYIAPIFIVVSFFAFTTFFPKPMLLIFRRGIYLVSLLAFILIITIVFSDLVIKDIERLPYLSEPKIHFGKLYWIYGLFITLVFATSFSFLIRSYKKNEGIERKLIGLIFIGTLAPSVVAIFTNLILPSLGIFNLNWLGQVFTISMVLVIAIAIAKHNFLNIKLFGVQIVIFAINIVTFLEIFSSSSIREYGLRILFFVVITVLMYTFLRSVKKEIEQKEELQKLTSKLSKANKELKKLDAAKSEFISIASHQLRTPLTAVKGYLSLIQEGLYGPMGNKMTEAFDKIYTANERLIQLVEDLLNISRIESGRMEYKLEVVDMGDVVQDLYDTFILRTQDEGLEFKIERDENEKYTVKADPSKIREVVSNLIDNAIKYTEQGWVHVILENRGDKVLVRIEDSGIGIPREVMKSLFQKFSRGKDQARLHVEGTGLGLYVGKNIVEHHDGRIIVDSAGAGKGSQFTVELPFFAGDVTNHDAQNLAEGVESEGSDSEKEK